VFACLSKASPCRHFRDKGVSQDNMVVQGRRGKGWATAALWFGSLYKGTPPRFNSSSTSVRLDRFTRPILLSRSLLLSFFCVLFYSNLPSSTSLTTSILKFCKSSGQYRAQLRKRTSWPTTTMPLSVLNLFIFFFEESLSC
jgi:hypothetical protein